MKITKLIPLLLFMLALTFYSCKKSDSKPKVSNLITYTYQDQKYTLPTPYLVAVENGTSLSIGGAVQGGPGLALLIENYQQGSSFEVGKQAYVNFNIPGGAVGFFCDGGTLVFNSLTQTHVSGTFSATSFKAGESDGPGTPVTGTFDVDIPQ
jgi:hypothetical protein